MIKVKIVAHSLNPQKDELISVLCTFPRIILAEVNTHRMLSKNTSSSRAIPFEKMVEAVQKNPFIPIAWQEDHKGMQGTEYLIDRKHENAVYEWLKARDYAIKQARMMNNDGITKQLCNRLLEPFMWTTMLITGSRESWNNFFNLRCPSYFGKYKSWNEWFIESKPNRNIVNWYDENRIEKIKENKGQAEIHMMALAESIYDAVNESTPKQLEAGEWHIPFENKINKDKLFDECNHPFGSKIPNKVRISTAMAARTSYTVIGDEKEVDYQKMIELHHRLISQNPPHSSPLEHCAKAMDNEEYFTYYKGKAKTYDNTIDKAYNHLIIPDTIEKELGYGWCYNFKGFVPYRYMIDNKINL